MPSNHPNILCHSLLLQPSIFPSIRVFSSESVLHIRWPKLLSLSFSISPSSENSGLISFRMEWLGLLAIQGTLKSLLQHHSSKAAILRFSASFRVQLSHPYMTTGKTIVWIRQILLAKYCLCFLICCLSSVQFNRSFVSDSLRPHESQHARPPCLSPTPGVHSDSRPLSQ